MFPGPSQMEIPGPNTRNGSRVAGALEAGQAVGMAEQHPDHRPETGPYRPGNAGLVIRGASKRDVAQLLEHRPQPPIPRIAR